MCQPLASLQGYDSFGWYGLGAPRHTPAEIINKLGDAMNDALADPKAKARLSELGFEPMPLTSDGFEKLIAEETDKWAKVIKSAGIKPPESAAATGSPSRSPRSPAARSAAARG